MLEPSKPSPALPYTTKPDHPAAFPSLTNIPLIPFTVPSFGSQSTALSSFTTFLTNAQCLYCLLSYLPWSDFVSLSQTCKGSRDLFHNEYLRDITLTRYVDGYGYCMRNRDPRLVSQMPVAVTLHDLDLLIISLSTPLHIYPAHALSILSSAAPSLLQQTRSQKLVRLAQAHSRFVLLLQSLAHSSSQSPPTEPEPETPLGVTSDIKHASHFRSRPSTGRHHIDEITAAGGIHNIRELRFPAPLSVSAFPETSNSRPARHSVSPSQGSASASSSTHSSLAPSSFHMSRSTTSKSTIKKKSRVSFFGGSGEIPPPHPSEPNDLKYHSWRQIPVQSAPHSRHTSSSTRRSASCFSEDDSPLSEFGVDEFRKPRPRFARSDSSLGSVSSSQTSASIGTPASTPQSASPCASPSTFHSLRSRSPHPASTAVSPHDLALATSRVRAPILRVFVPCSQLSEQPDPNSALSTGSIEQCEQQLIEAGLWEHLSTGDVVCNLGYVPGSEGSTSSGNSEDEGDGLGFISRSRRTHNTSAQTQKWLIFNGELLVPFSPADRVPHDDPLSLPSPWYYDHIIPPVMLSSAGIKQSNLALTPAAIILKRLPPFLPQIPQLTLINYASKVQSPHSRGGVARVRKWVWIARIWRGRGVTLAEWTSSQMAHGPAFEMGVGWEGEWILESDGTKEGRQVLLNTIKGIRKHTEHWEFIREQSGGGRIWLRLVNSNDLPRREIQV